MRIVWDTDEVDEPGFWDWATLIDSERGHVEIIADSDDRQRVDNLMQARLKEV
jgi:hypothetical protein